jgi:hypothetical protein
MDGISAGLFGGINDLINNQVTFSRRRWPDKICFIGIAYMHGGTISLRKYSNSGDPHFPARAHYPDGNFSPVRYEDFLYHKN